MKNYKINMATKTLTITKDFEEKAMIPNSEESKIIEQFRSLCPDLRIAYRTRKVTTKSPFKGLTYERMARYILCHENAGELISLFDAIKMISLSQPSPYSYVSKWFLRQFPDYRSAPILRNGKIPAVEPICNYEADTVSIEALKEAI